MQVDLQRDSRLVVHSVQCNRETAKEDIKLYGRATDIQDPSLRSAFRDAIQARINWAPDEPAYHLFSVEVERAAYIAFQGGQQHLMAWDPQAGFRRWAKQT